jgi:hypothetical protein
MAGRSLKPASYLASAAQAAPNRSPRQRPAFTRSSSGSSVTSTKSEDSMVVMLKGMVLEGREGKEDASAGQFSAGRGFAMVHAAEWRCGGSLLVLR